MWTDEQLLEQGWTQPQIDQWRNEQQSPAADIPAVHEPAMPLPTSEPTTAVATPEPSIPIAETKPGSLSGISAGISSEKTQLILIVIMLVVAPLSLYSSLFAEGPTGAQGEEGVAGVNGTAGSSFHLVLSGEELPTCDQTINNQIFFVADVSGFEVCQDNAWTTVDLTGEQGQAGTDGADGQAGADGQDGTNGTDGQSGTDGADGQDGTNGVDGQNGLTSLIVSSVEPNGANCPNGGTRVETGVDDDGNGLLTLDEVDDLLFVCNGENGTDGTDGVDGTDGADGADGTNGSSTTTTMVARLSIAPAYLGCNGTGELLQQGMDNGAGNGIALNGVLESGEVISSALICTTFEVAQVHDINPLGHANPTDFATINSTLYFTAYNGSVSGIWSLDANDNLTLVHTGTALNMRAVGSQLMFLGQSASLDVEPWVFEPTNGTAWQIADIFPGNSGSFAGEFTLLGTTVFFSARDSAGSTGLGLYDLWAYETVNHSVWKVEPDIQPTNLVAVNSDLYFSAGINNANVELWKHEIATNTTFMVQDIRPGNLGSSPQHLVVMGTTIYMSAIEGTVNGGELYAYNTLANATSLAADIRPGVASSMISETAVLGTRVYMTATSGTHFELWVYESQNQSFWQASNLQITTGNNAPAGLTVHDYTVYFSADDGTTGEELWAHNSINATVWQVIDLKPTGGSIGDIHVHGGNVYFSGEDNWDGRELWRLIFSKDVTFV